MLVLFDGMTTVVDSSNWRVGNGELWRDDVANLASFLRLVVFGTEKFKNRHLDHFHTIIRLQQGVGR